MKIEVWENYEKICLQYLLKIRFEASIEIYYDSEKLKLRIRIMHFESVTGFTINVRFPEKREKWKSLKIRDCSSEQTHRNCYTIRS